MAYINVRHKKIQEKCIGDETVLIDMVKSLEGLLDIPEKEKVALQLCSRLYERMSRGNDGDEQWVQVGYDM